MKDPACLEPYTLHIYDISYFSGKMQAYLAYKGIPHRTNEIRWQELVDRVAPQTGLVEVPVVECADGSFMRDSTAMIEWFERHYRVASVLPDDPASAFYCRLLEDYADEGLWRPALYYRWAFDKDAELYSRRFTEDFLSYPLTPAALLRLTVRDRQRRVYLRGEGITPENRADVERHYIDELADLEAIFRRRPFLFGDRPSLADFGYFASMFRHFGIDPTPSRIMRNTAPAVYEWIARMWNARAARLGGLAWASGSERAAGRARTSTRTCGTAIPALSSCKCASRRRTTQPLLGNARRKKLCRTQGGTVPGMAPRRAATGTGATRATRGRRGTRDTGTHWLLSNGSSSME